MRWALAAGKGRAVFAYLGVVAFGQAQHHTMDAGHLRGSDDLLAVHVTHAGDVLGHRSCKKFHILRQIADVGAQFF